VLAVPGPAAAYSVLSHEASVDAMWDSDIRPLLARRFPSARPVDIEAARAYAYGGSVIQDLGYYPFGNRFFSNLVHYVRGGDFVEALVRDARDVDELAFALGALSHYAADAVGHPEAVNKSVPLMFPKLRAKFGDTITYAEAPANHVIVEFSFDVVQVAAGAYLPDRYHQFIGFKVARPLLDRAFRETYGLETTDVFGDEDLAISTYRRAVSEWIPELTRIAWRDKRDEIERLAPGVTENAFIYRYTRRQYEQEFGRAYHSHGTLARLVGVFYRILPKVGPLKPLSFKAPTPGAQTLFERSFKDTRARYAAALAAVRRQALDLPNVNFDIGRPGAHGTYALADKTYADLLERYAERKFAGMPPALRRNITAYYAGGLNNSADSKERRRAERVERHLVEMRASAQ
jgi:Zinc dependent phospholipase C